VREVCERLEFGFSADGVGDWHWDITGSLRCSLKKGSHRFDAPILVAIADQVQLREDRSDHGFHRLHTEQCALGDALIGEAVGHQS
jgi:hypothetical protein